MTWVGLSDQRMHLLSPMGDSGIFPRGSLIMETKVSPHTKPQTLIGLELRGSDIFDLAIQAMPGGGIHFLMRNDDETLHAALSHDAEDQANLLRISYSWDVETNSGRLAIERPGTHKVYIRELEHALPLSNQAITGLITPSGRRFVSEDMVYMAVSDAVEPIGPMPAFCPKSPVQTPTGLRQIGDLKRGDLVTTLNGDAVPVLQSLRKVMPARGSFQPVRLRAPYFGLKQDIVMTPEARLVVGGTQVEYLFGAENVLVPVKHLTSAASAQMEGNHPLVSYVQLLLPDHESILVGGTAVESLSIGRLRRKKHLLAASTLAEFDPHTLPEHSKTAFPVLKNYEAVTLAKLRAA